MHRTKNLRLTWLLLLAAILGGCQPRQQLVEQHLLEFGTIIQISLVTDDLPRAERLLEEIEARLHRYRSYWSSWEDSDLTRFNADLQQHREAPVPASLARLLRLCRDYYVASGGLFDPAIGKLISAWGFHGSPPNEAEIARLRADMPSMRDLEIDGDRAFSHHPDLEIDLGGIAKGYAIGLVGEFLDDNGIDDYIVNAGGDMLISGNKFGRPWRIGIQDPYAPGVVAGIEIAGRHSLFTSGNYRRRYLQGGELEHHIMDPRSGKPARGQSSATVLVDDPVRADVAATVLMIDGTHNSRKLALSLGVKNYLIVTESREIRVSGPFAEKLEIEPGWKVEIIN
ncbi:MAG: FAD:protein FMN transferase [Gammaproteobacteria bacterium]